MLRSFAAAAIFVSCFTVAGWAQSPSATSAPATSTPASSVAKKAAPKTKPAESGSCQFGPLKLTDTYERVSVDGWALDELVVSRVRAAAPGMSVRRIPFTKEELANYPRPAFRFRRDETIEKFAKYVARGRNCERYVLVHRHGGSQREFGIGISKHYLGSNANLFAMMYIRVYDGRTFQLINEAPALMEEDTYANRFKYHLGGPSRPIDLAMFPEKAADAAKSPVLRDGVRQMLTVSLDRTLPGMLRPQSREAAR
jgi:hypothetical protein